MVAPAQTGSGNLTSREYDLSPILGCRWADQSGPPPRLEMLIKSSDHARRTWSQDTTAAHRSPIPHLDLGARSRVEVHSVR